MISNYSLNTLRKSYWILTGIVFILLYTLCNGCYQNENDITSEQNTCPNEQITTDSNLVTIVDKFNYIKLLYDSLVFFNKNEIHPEVCRIKTEIAEEMRKSGNYFEGITLFNEALKQNREINATEQNGKIFNGLSAIYYELFIHNRKLFNYLDSSLLYAERALEISIKEKNISLQANTLNIIGGINIHKNNYNSAIQYLLLADSINTNIETGLAIKNNLAYVYYKLGDYRSALPLAKEALINSVNTKNLVFSGISLENMIKIYYAMGDSSYAIITTKK